MENEIKKSKTIPWGGKVNAVQQALAAMIDEGKALIKDISIKAFADAKDEVIRMKEAIPGLLQKIKNILGISGENAEDIPYVEGSIIANLLEAIHALQKAISNMTEREKQAQQKQMGNNSNLAPELI